MKLMLLFTVFILGVTFLSYTGTKALFSDSSASTANVFSASAEFPQPTPAVANHVVISEVQINGSNANEDFVELYNPTNDPIDLSDWNIRKKVSSGTDSSLVVIVTGTIQAHGYFLWSNNQGTFETEIGADVSNTNNLSENNSVALLDDEDNVVDQIAWGSATNPQYIEGTAFPNSSDGDSSIERKAKSTSTTATMNASGIDEFKGNGFDLDNNATDFVLRAVSQPQNSSSAIETP